MGNTILKKINIFRRKFPTHLQFDQTDCGATCVKIILDYHGIKVPSSYIKEICFTDLQGANILDVSNALKHFNFEVVTTKIDVDSLVENGKTLPAVLLFDNNHYVVLYKITKKGFHVSDPEFGKYVIDRKLFLKRWLSDDRKKGVIVFSAPGKGFTMSGRSYSEPDLKKVFYDQYIKSNAKTFVYIVLISALLALANLAFPVLTKKIVDEAIPHSDYGLLAIIVLAQITIILAGNISGFINDRIFIKVTSSLNIAALSKFLYKLSRIPFKFFELKNVSDIVQRVGDHIRIEAFVTNNVSATIYSVISVVAFSALLLQYNGIIFLVFLFSLFMSFLWTVSFSGKRNLVEYKRFSSYKSGMGSSFEIVQGMVELKLNNAEDYRIREWQNKQKNIYQTKEESLILESKIAIGNLLIAQLKNAFITFACAYLVINKSLTLGEMLSISYIIGVLNAPLGTFLGFMKKWNETKFSFSRIHEVNEMPEEDGIGTVRQINDFQSICFQNVCFKYNPNAETNILEGGGMTIKKGQKIAFVGKSGSGKTTLMKLLLKFYAPTRGSVFVDGVDLRDIQAKKWRNLCGVVMQDGYLFTGSVLDNIILDKTDIDMGRLDLVCKLANIKEYIESLPKKYDTIIGQNGKGMSGGQRQRILIARALYKNPEILIFDEATSALDTHNEAVIMENIYNRFENKTMIVIAHRLSTIKNVDVIYVFNEGRMVESGNHQELLAKKNEYYRLVKNQLESLAYDRKPRISRPSGV